MKNWRKKRKYLGYVGSIGAYGKKSSGKNTLAQIMQCSTKQSTHYYGWLVDNGYLTASKNKYDQATYKATETGKPYVIGKIKNTLLFSEEIVKVFPLIIDFSKVKRNRYER